VLPPVTDAALTPVCTDAVSTGLHSSDLSVLLQDGEAWNVRENACTAPRQEQLGLHRAGDFDQHPAALRENNKREHVLRGPAPQLSRRRDQHLLHLQAHFAEDLAKRHEICDDDRRSRPR
jgi:hypothetical protein